jgi:parvulin-like peptidyl-prolyl isomerase
MRSPNSLSIRSILVCTLVLGLASTALAQKKRAAGKAEAPRRIVDRVVAVVNDAVVLNSELMICVAPMSGELENIKDVKERRRRQEKLKSQILDEMVNEELIVQAADESKLEVSAKEVQNALDEIKRQNKLDDNQLAEALRLQGYSLASYRKDVRRQILRMRAVNMLVRPRVTVTDDDVRAKYDANNRRSASVSKVRLRHVLVALPTKPSERQLSEAKEKAAKVIQRARNGEDFSELAKALSNDESSAPSGGDLGWIERGSIPTEWEVIVFAMAKGETRGPIDGPRGLHVFHVSDLEKNAAKAFEEVKDKIRNDLVRREMDRQTSQWLDELRKKAHIQSKL